MQNYKIIQSDRLAEIAGTDSLILDVRTVVEHDEKHIGFPHDHVVLDQLDPQDFMLRRGLTKDDHLYILCASGKRARVAADRFMQAGYPHVHVIEGGIGACEASGHPIKGHGAEKSAGSKTGFSPERQALIIAGVLVATGAALNIPFLPLVVGAGMVLVGVTNRCGLAMLLAQAPWNKKRTHESSTTTCNTGGSCAGGTCAGGSAAADEKPVGKSCQ